MSRKQCAACGGSEATGGWTTVLGHTWHTGHVRCAVCKLDLTTTTPFLDAATTTLYCASHYNALHHLTCAACGDVLVGAYVFELDKHFHPACFVCAAPGCGAAFTAAYYTHAGRPYCETHYFERTSRPCAACARPIVDSAFARAYDQHYHSACFVCAACSAPLDHGYIRTSSGALQCPACAQAELRANMENAAAAIAGPSASSSPSRLGARGATMTAGARSEAVQARGRVASARAATVARRRSWARAPAPELVGADASPAEQNELMRHRIRVFINHLGAHQYGELRNAVLAVVKQVHLLSSILAELPGFDTRDLVNGAVVFAAAARPLFGSASPDPPLPPAALAPAIRDIVTAARSLSDAGARAVELHASFTRLGQLPLTTPPLSEPGADAPDSPPAPLPRAVDAARRVDDDIERKRASSGSELADDVPTGNFDRDAADPDALRSELDVFVAHVLSESKELKLGSPDYHRQELIRQIITTEDEYVANLATVIHDHLAALRAADPPLLSAASREVIFCNIEAIAAFHTDLLASFKTARTEAGVLTSLTPLLAATMSDLTSLYHTYGINTSMAVAELAAIRAAPDAHAPFLSFLATTRAKLGWRKETRLEHYLLLPLKRLAEFTLLVRQLAAIDPDPAHPSAADSDHATLTAIAAQLDVLVANVHKARSEMDAWHAVIKAKASIKNCPFDITASSERTLRKGGPLELAGHTLTASTKLATHYVFLFSDVIVWTKPTKKEGLFVFKGMAALVDVAAFYQNPAVPAAFTIELVDSTAVHWVAASENERTGWLLALGPTLAEFQHELANFLATEAPTPPPAND